MAKLTREDVERIVEEARERGERPDLIRADLSGMNLSHTNLFSANLDHANLFGTNLTGASMFGTYLTNVDLTCAILSGTILSNAHLVGTNLHEAYLDLTSLSNLDLRETKGLETVRHSGPSSIGIDTLQHSQGQIPEVFLRGCGLSDVQIEMAKLHNPNLSQDQITDITYKIHNLLTGPAIRYAHCFISYSTRDEPFAKRLYDDLQNSGVRCWFAPEDLKRGEFLKTQIDEAIKVHDKVLLILSEESLKSERVKYEISRARQEELLNRGMRKFFPIRLVDMDVIKGWDWQEDEITGGNLAEYVEQYYIPDLSREEGYEREFKLLLRDLAQASG